MAQMCVFFFKLARERKACPLKYAGANIQILQHVCSALISAMSDIDGHMPQSPTRSPLDSGLVGPQTVNSAYSIPVLQPPPHHYLEYDREYLNFLHRTSAVVPSAVQALSTTIR